MAAHVLRALKELESGDCTAEQLRHAISYAALGDNLEWADWQLLYNIKSDERFKELALGMIPMYTRKWKELGEPRTAEEWLERRSHV